MKKLFFLLTIVLCNTSQIFAGELIEYLGIVYEAIDGDSVEVRFRYNYATQEMEPYEGNIVIPREIWSVHGIPYRVTGIGEEAFKNCTKLTSISLPRTLSTIGNGAFYGCTGLSSISFPSTLYLIGSEAFRGCTGLTSISLPSTLRSIGYDAFADCTGISKTIYLGDIDSWCSINFGNEKANSIYYSHNLYVNQYDEVVNKVTLVKDVPSYVFYGLSNLKAVTLAEKGQDIDYHESFATSLGDWRVEDIEGVANFHHYSQYQCAYINGYNKGTNTDYFISPAFDLTNTEQAYLTFEHTNAHGNANSWGDRCKVLISDDYHGDVTQATWKEFEIKFTNTNWEFIKVKKSIPKKYLGKDNIRIAFYYNNITNNDSPAWEIKNVKLMSTAYRVNEVGVKAFGNCSALTEITSQYKNPPRVSYHAFTDIPSDVTITVPCGAEASYRAADGWNKIANINEGNIYELKVYGQDDTMGVVEILQQPNCTQNAIIEALPKEKYKFQHWNDGNTDNPRTIEVTKDVEYIATFAPISDSVDNICAENTSAIRKALENGIFYILRNGEKYTIDGRKVM